MDLKQLFDNLQDSRVLISQYVDLNYKAWNLRYKVQNYNRKKVFSIVSIVGAGILAFLLATPSSGKTDYYYMMVVGVILYFILRYAVGSWLDRVRRKSLMQESEPILEKMTDEMNAFADRLEDFTVLPPKYWTIHAVDKISEYIINKRVDNLKEGLNLYEEELFRIEQLQKQNFQIQQNFRLMLQNRELIRAQKITNKRLLWTR